jgi:D-sedoheptulose 7-phosphate isomerase
MCLPLIALSGFSLEYPLKKFREIIFWVDFQEYSNIEMTHHVWLLAIVDYIIKQKGINP